MNDSTNGGSNDQTRRRTVLKRVGTAGFVGAFSGVAGAKRQPKRISSELDARTKRELKQAAEEYDSIGAVRTALAEQGKPLLKTLEANGFVDDHSLESLPITEIITPTQHTPGTEDGVMVVGVSTPEGPTARIQTVTTTEQYTTVITVDAHHENARALVRGQQTRRIVYPDGEIEVVE